MSKVIENLSKPFRKNIQTSLHEDIARTYLKTSHNKAVKGNLKSKAPWVVAAVALLLALAVLISRSNIDIRIRILSEVPSVRPDVKRSPFDLFRDKGIFFVKGAEVNSYLIKNALFLGDAKTHSKRAEETLVFSNSRLNGWANYTLELKEPLDLTKFDLKYIAKGATGDERIGIVIIDADNRSYRMESAMSTKLSNDWQAYTINFRPVRNAIDLSNISIIKFEFGSLTVGNSSSSTMFIRDIYAVKTRRS